MNLRLFAVMLALVVAPLSVPAADEEHPLKKSKVGDFATYTKTMKDSRRNDESSVTYTVVLNCDKENAVIIKAKANFKEELGKIDLSKPFDPTKLPMLERGGYEYLKDVKSEKAEESKETIKVGDNEYECTRITHKLKGKAAETLDCDVTVTVWMSKDLPLGFVKLNWKCADVTAKKNYELTLELTESGNKK